jgi:hypothetical protein
MSAPGGELSRPVRSGDGRSGAADLPQPKSPLRSDDLGVARRYLGAGDRLAGVVLRPAIRPSLLRSVPWRGSIESAHHPKGEPKQAAAPVSALAALVSQTPPNKRMQLAARSL